MRITQVSSGLMTTHALISAGGRSDALRGGRLDAERQLQTDREAAARSRGTDDEFAARRIRDLRADALGHGNLLAIRRTSCCAWRQACDLAAMCTAARIR